MAVASGVQLFGDNAAPPVYSASSNSGDLAREKDGSMSAGEDDGQDLRAGKQDGIPPSGVKEVAVDGETNDEDQFVLDIKMLLIVLALVMGVFLLSLDMVCFVVLVLLLSLFFLFKTEEEE